MERTDAGSGAMTRLFPFIILLVMPSITEGHGRNSTSIRADVRKDEVRLVISAVVVDLLELTGTAMADWENQSSDGRKRILRQGSRLLLDRIRVVVNSESMPPAGAFTISLPDEESGPDRWLPANQQSVTIEVGYPLSGAPGELLFWANLVTGSKGRGFPAQILVRQGGELVLLPAGIGTGLPLAVSLDWNSSPEPVAERAGLSSAVAGWRNRAANAILVIGRGELSWRVFVPARLLIDALSLPRDAGIEALEELMAPHFSLSMDGEALEGATKSLQLFTMSAHDIAHGTSEPAVDWLGGMVELRLCFTLEAVPNEVQLRCSLIGNGIPVLYTSVVHKGEPPHYFLQGPDAPVLTWNATP